MAGLASGIAIGVLACSEPKPARERPEPPAPPAPAPTEPFEPRDSGGSSPTPSDTAPPLVETPYDLLVSDASGVVYRVNALGQVVREWTPDLPGLTGVAFDAAAGDGFWASSSFAMEPFVKYALDGSRVDQVFEPDFPYGERRGLDFVVPHVDFPSPNPVLVVVGTNDNGIQAALTVDAVTGQRVQAFSFADEESFFLEGFWGVSHPRSSALPSTRPAAPATFTRGDELWWFTESVVDTKTPIAIPLLLGVTVLDDGTLWVVDGGAAMLRHLDPQGVELEAFPAPGGAPLDVSWIPN